mmetsp:Transcript_5237/g.14635  ORF Transcript_5237/g.14635 Transcript_5237/m.14635 type:complete len:489 (+) Transcript_5237:672-2138(+)|eukprot:CAMPEP_0117662506 /NCGR_PEP_ID=MMETSP0804-20121206/8087_1 /TAXON_ID=1074897 /ORGANISM="Tetraselmis astigmatica, Strain CCMP880" /LENGTH=488 /DNA_ID=CAMNT_0005469405 /DNA_START=734 /DNA_END=2200 /DNA_ORIENTATION=+
MGDLGLHVIETCRVVLAKLEPQLTDEEQKQAIQRLIAWLINCQTEEELLQAEINLDAQSRSYLLSWRNKLSDRNYMAKAIRNTSPNSTRPVGTPEKTKWLGPLDEWSSKLLHCVIRPDSSQGWVETPELQEELEKLYSWDDFNVFRIAILAEGHPLEIVSMKVVKDLNLFEHLNLNEDKFRSFVQAAERTYRPDNMYHNNIHAADVTQSLAVLLSYEEMRSQLSPIEQMVIVLAAISHDIGHPGVNNDFLINSESEEAKIYHDRSVNENMHLRYTFNLLGREENNFIENLSKADYWFLRQSLIKAILNTDMAVHTSLLHEFENHISIHGPNLDDWNHDHRQTALNMFVHCADIANPAKPGPFARCWTWRVQQEFYSQGDKERELGISISPSCVRGKVDVPKCQLTFLQYCVRPSYEALAHLFPKVATAPLKHIEESILHWKSHIQDSKSEPPPEGAPEGVDTPNSVEPPNGASSPCSPHHKVPKVEPA